MIRDLQVIVDDAEYKNQNSHSVLDIFIELFLFWAVRRNAKISVVDSKNGDTVSATLTPYETSIVTRKKSTILQSARIAASS